MRISVKPEDCISTRKRSVSWERGSSLPSVALGGRQPWRLLKPCATATSSMMSQAWRMSLRTGGTDTWWGRGRGGELGGG